MVSDLQNILLVKCDVFGLLEEAWKRKKFVNHRSLSRYDIKLLISIFSSLIQLYFGMAGLQRIGCTESHDDTVCNKKRCNERKNLWKHGTKNRRQYLTETQSNKKKDENKARRNTERAILELLVNNESVDHPLFVVSLEKEHKVMKIWQVSCHKWDLEDDSCTYFGHIKERGKRCFYCQVYE
ncbi:hypothetical protein HELRODRAFT_182467 [Helobdella robusta]|uniref:Uncharacterized protein n=1 Tax=Helobdella robusta TaxID=6412 RepID=T1FI88_HELRO|nr:hypothetical protein HELRODRAFT_182467 [Helobdella robusta]ESN90889.1 hypothetical protein HELRODRAFT_182467 [Helobdella robusta]